MHLRSFAWLGLVFVAAPSFAQTAKHPLKLDDIARFREVRDPQFSPDGKWVAYVVSDHRRQGRQEQSRTSGWSATTARTTAR